MEQGDLSWSSGVAERFVARLRETCDARMRQLGERQRRIMQHATSERQVVESLLGYRREFAKLHRLVSVPTLPESARMAMQKLIVDCASQAQSSLEESAQHDRSGRLAFLVRSTSVSHISQ